MQKCFRRIQKRKRKRAEDELQRAQLLRCFLEQEEDTDNSNRNILLLTAVLVVANEIDYLLANPYPIVPDWRFHPENLQTYKAQGLCAKDLFRFDVDQLHQLIQELRIPLILRTSSRDRFYAMEGLCIVLRRLVFPVRWKDVVCLFGRQTGPLSRIHKHMMKWIYRR